MRKHTFTAILLDIAKSFKIFKPSRFLQLL